MYRALFGLPIAALSVAGIMIYGLPIPIAGPLLLGGMLVGTLLDEVRRQRPLRVRR